MADDVEMTPVEMTPVASEPPKVNPLAPAGKPVMPKPATAANPTMAIKPGLKLPPKPGLATAGLKLPPKPGLATAGLKLPPKPGATIAAKPLIRKPGMGAPVAGIPKPVSQPLPKPVAPAAATPPATPAAAPAEKPVDTLKKVTQQLKATTQQIPQTAILHKTGIVAEVTTDAQKEAAKHKTARISLSDAMGVAPVKEEPAPMKTIRIKRPEGIAGSPAPAPASAAPAAEGETSVTQRKTLKITRPTAPVRPAGKFTVKKPGAAPAAATEEKKADDVADIPDIPEMPNNVSAFGAPQPVAVEAKPGPATTVAILIQIAACVVIGVLVWYFYENSQLPTFCGGLGWGA